MRPPSTVVTLSAVKSEGNNRIEEEDGRTEAPSAPLGLFPRRNAGLLEIDMGDGAIVYDRQHSQVHHLNPPASLVWRFCDGSSTVGLICQRVAEVSGTELHVATKQVSDLIAEFEELGLLEPEDGTVRLRPSDRPGFAGA
jgi:hypothetical protein